MGQDSSSTDKEKQILAKLILKTLEMEERLKEILGGKKNSEESEE